MIPQHLTSGIYSPSSFGFYDVLYDYLKSANLAESKRVGSAEVVPPVSALFGDLRIQTFQELVLLPIMAIHGYSAEDINANGNKLLVNWDDTQHYVDTVGLLMGMHHFNNGIGSVVRELTGINETCNVRLTTEIFDSESSKTKSVYTFLHQITKLPGRHPSALFGATWSSVSAPLAVLDGLYEIPQISSTSTSTDLDNRDNFRYFSRLVPSDAGTARAIVDYFRSRLDVTHCGIIFINDAYGGSYMQVFKDNAVDRPEGDQIAVKSFGFTDGSEVELKFAVQQMKDSGYRVFFGVFYDHHFETIMNEAVRLGIAGPGYVWIVGDGITHGFLNGLKFQKGSPLAIATQGLGVIQAGGGLKSSSGDKGFERFVEAWHDQEDEAALYYNYKQPSNNTMDNANELYYKAEPGSFKSGQLSPPTSGGLFYYDSIIGLGMAACRLVSASKVGDSYIDGKDLFSEFIQSSFEGSSGKIKIDHKTASRDPSSATFVLYNANGVENGEDVSFTVSIVSHTIHNPDNSPNSVFWKDVDGKSFVYSDGSARPPPVLPPIQGENLNQLNNLRYLGIVFSTIILLCSLFFGFWTCSFHKVRVVRSAQPMFLVMICVGTFMLGTAILLLSIDDQVSSIWLCNVACVMTPWLMSLGDVVVFSALFSKIWRINKIFLNSTSFRRIKVTSRDVVLPFVILFSLNTIVLLVWTITSPPRWERIVRSGTDEFGRSVESYGMCKMRSDKDIVYKILILIINISVVILANVQAYRARNITTEFSEAKYLAVVNTVILQCCIVGAPVSFLAHEHPPTIFFVRSGMLFVVCLSILLVVFIPKMIFMKRWQKQEEQKKMRRKQSQETTDCQIVYC